MPDGSNFEGPPKVIEPVAPKPTIENKAVVESPPIPNAEDIATQMQVDEAETERVKEMLASAGLVTPEQKTIEPVPKVDPVRQNQNIIAKFFAWIMNLFRRR